MDSSGWRLAQRSVSDDIDGKGADFRRRADAGAQPLRMIPASSGRRLTKHENVQAGGGAERRGGRLTSALGAIHDARWPLKIGLGLAASLSGVVLRLALEPGAFGHLPYQAFYPGVIAASILGGLLPGVAAAAAGAFWGVLFATPADPAPALRLALFLLNSVAISGLAEAMHRALWRLGEADGRGAEAERLLIANERFRLTQAAEAIAAFDLDIERNVASDVDALRRMFGFAPGAMINPDTVRSVALKDDAANIQAALEAAYDPAGDGAYAADYRIRRPSDGEERWIAARGQVFFDGLRPVRMIGVCRDVTGERTADHALRISRAQIPLFVERAPISVAMFDRDMVYLAASRGWIEAYGRGRKTLIGLSHYELHPDIPDRWKAVHRGVLNGEFHTADDDRWVDSEGQERWIRWAAYPWTDEAGGIGGVILSADEITAQKRAEAALRESEEKFRNAFAEAAVGFVMGDAGGAILEVNRAFCRLTGYSEDELKSMRLTDLLHPDDRAEDNALNETLAAAKPRLCRRKPLCPQGRRNDLGAQERVPDARRRSRTPLDRQTRRGRDRAQDAPRRSRPARWRSSARSSTARRTPSSRSTSPAPFNPSTPPA